MLSLKSAWAQLFARAPLHCTPSTARSAAVVRGLAAAAVHGVLRAKVTQPASAATWDRVAVRRVHRSS